MPLTPLVEPLDGLDEAESIRTARHRRLAGFGDISQRRLAAAHVAVVGAGGLGSPVTLALCAAGVGTLTIIDDDHIEASNLQRQIMHRRQDVGHRKVDSAARVAADLSQTRVIARAERLDGASAAELLAGADLVIDGTDTFDTRVAVAEACEALGIPLVWGTVQAFDAQVTVFWSAPTDGVAPVRLSDLYPSGSVGEVPTCEDVGVLGTLCVQVGAVMATQAVSLLTGVGDPLLGRILVIDGLRSRHHEIPLRARESSVLERRATASEPVPAPPSVSAAHLRSELARGTAGDLLDVREPDETAGGVIDGARLIPLADVLAHPVRAADGPVTVICKAGVRARRAAEALRAAGHDARVLTGGMDAWIAEGGTVTSRPIAANPAATPTGASS